MTTQLDDALTEISQNLIFKKNGTENVSQEAEHSVLVSSLLKYPEWDKVSQYIDVSEETGKIYISDLKENDSSVIACLDYLEFCKINFSHESIPASEMIKRVEERRISGGIAGLKVDSNVQQAALDLFEKAAKKNASDIHLEVGEGHTEIEFRINGDLERQSPLSKADGEYMIQAIMNSMLKDGASMYKPNERQDGRIADSRYLPNIVGSLRVATGPIEGGGRLMVLRLLYKDTSAIFGGLEKRLKRLGYNDSQIRDIRAGWDKPSGISLMSGPTGSGKSTTLKHILECKKIEHPEENFMSIEDPPEYRIEGVRQIAADKTKFAQVINFCLRADPDKMLVGEIRDSATLSMAIKVALSGHGVSASVHANSAFGIIKRLVDMMRSHENPEPINSLADETVITTLIFQKLVKNNCPSCALKLDEAKVRPDLMERLKLLFSEDELKNIRFQNTQGCSARDCDKGIIGREVVAEVVVTNEKLMEILKKEGDFAAKRYWQEEMGGLTVVDHAISKVRTGQIAPDVAERAVGPLTENVLK